MATLTPRNKCLLDYTRFLTVHIHIYVHVVEYRTCMHRTKIQKYYTFMCKHNFKISYVFVNFFQLKEIDRLLTSHPTEVSFNDYVKLNNALILGVRGNYTVVKCQNFTNSCMIFLNSTFSGVSTNFYCFYHTSAVSIIRFLRRWRSLATYLHA